MGQIICKSVEIVDTKIQYPIYIIVMDTYVNIWNIFYVHLKIPTRNINCTIDTPEILFDYYYLKN